MAARRGEGRVKVELLERSSVSHAPCFESDRGREEGGWGVMEKSEK